jgi:hypothetical protein
MWPKLGDSAIGEVAAEKCCVFPGNPLSLRRIIRMKTIRVPWIRCRADEADAIPFEMEWRGRGFQVLAYSEKEAWQWWRDLSEREREDYLGGNGAAADEEMGLF